MPYTVVFVCSGNICRSPAAATVFRARAAEAGLAGRVDVASVGIGPWHVGEPMDRRTAATLRDAGYDTAHTARQIDDATAGADLLVAATADHREALLDRGVDDGRVVLLRAFDPDVDADAPGGADVPDPYYGGPHGFSDVLAMIEAAMPGLVRYVAERVAERA